MNTSFQAGFQHGFFYGAVSMALLALGIWLACVIRDSPAEDGVDFPWCEDCRSWHHPNNKDCASGRSHVHPTPAHKAACPVCNIDKTVPELKFSQPHKFYRDKE